MTTYLLIFKTDATKMTACVPKRRSGRSTRSCFSRMIPFCSGAAACSAGRCRIRPAAGSIPSITARMARVNRLCSAVPKAFPTRRCGKASVKHLAVYRNTCLRSCQPDLRRRNLRRAALDTRGALRAGRLVRLLPWIFHSASPACGGSYAAGLFARKPRYFLQDD